jgi:phospholipid/cholesterol/gamma-HCH transport system substrate-binding protein
MTDRTLGFSVILFLIVFVIVPGLYLTSKALAPIHNRTIFFDSINTGSFLRIQDPVRVQGFEAGIIRNVAWDKGKTVVTIETEKPLAIHRGYSFIAEAKGLMGDRYLEINPGRPDAPLVDKKDTLYGTFPLGPTEAIAFMDRLKTMVDSIVEISRVLKNGSSEKPSFISRFHSVTKSLDSIVVSLEQLVGKTDRMIGTNADSLATALRQADAYSRQLGAAVPGKIASLGSIIDKTEKLLVAVDTLVSETDRLVKKANGPEVMAFNRTVVRLKVQIETLRDVLADVRKKGVALPVTIR